MENINSTDKDFLESKPINILMIVNMDIDLSNELCMEGMHFSCAREDQALQRATEMKPDAIMAMYRPYMQLTEHIYAIRTYSSEHSIPFILHSMVFNQEIKDTAVRLKFDDYCYGNVTKSLSKKFQILRKSKQTRHTDPPETADKKSLPAERIFDIVVSSFILLVLLPVLLLVAVLIKLESKGPVFYVSKRAGSNYRIFDFYKFRSMFQDAESRLVALKDKNQYGDGAFIKIKDDPRVTRVGKFLRKTSLDEVPQLFNILKGDMSLVGNRPLPLYEAEKLTRDEIAHRFLAPAGITGLWQITKRGKGEMSEDERIRLDIEYAQKYSFLFDMRLLISTLPAVLQKEAV